MLRHSVTIFQSLLTQFKDRVNRVKTPLMRIAFGFRRSQKSPVDILLSIPLRTMNSNSAIIKIQNLSRSFLTDELETKALDGIHLEISKGDFVSIEGPSGSGKSTLLSIIGLLDSPSGGDYLFDNVAIHNLSRNQRADIRNQKIGFVFQSFNLVGDMNVLKNVELPLRYRNISSGERRERAIKALEKVNMSHRLKHFPNQLSGGQQQRVAVARAIVGEPQILLADEPTGNLDSHNGEAVMDILQSLNDEGVTICMVTHDERYRKYAGRTIELFDGKIVSESSVESENLSQPAHEIAH